MSDSKTSKAPVLIAGAGLTGLSCAYHLHLPHLLWEKEEQVGGLARTRIVKNGFHFDYTGHWLHTRQTWTRQLVTETLGIELAAIERLAAIHSHGTKTPYPFQAHTHGLPTSVVAECLLGYFAARERRAKGLSGQPQSFGDLIRDQLGEGIAKHFMFPYNTKLWTVPPDELSAKWCKRFVPTVEPDEVIYGALRPEGIGHRIGYNNLFYYPTSGGIGVLPKRLNNALKSPARCTTPLVQVDYKARMATDAQGQTTSFRALVSTLPLTELVAMLKNPPTAIRDAAAKLRAASVTYFNIAFKGADKAGSPHWVYFPESEFPFYRLGSPSAVHSSLAPLQHRSYWVELAHRHGTPCAADERVILEALERAGYCAPGEQPLVFERHNIPIAYVILDKQAEQSREEILAWLRGQGIYSTGRYGAWTYNSMEDSLVAGRQAAQWVEEYCGNI